MQHPPEEVVDDPVVPDEGLIRKTLVDGRNGGPVVSDGRNLLSLMKKGHEEGRHLI